jgi:hypothetical protein
VLAERQTNIETIKAGTQWRTPIIEHRPGNLASGVKSSRIDERFAFDNVIVMPAANLDASELASLVQPERIAAQGFLAPKRVSVVDGTDHSGDEAYYVSLVYASNTPDAALDWFSVKPTVRWVRDEIRRASGEARWPYVRVKREAHLRAGRS